MSRLWDEDARVNEVGGGRRVRLVNLTGHPLSVGSLLMDYKLRAEGRARVSSKMTHTDQIGLGLVTIPILDVRESGVLGLPDPQEGILFIVSGITAVKAGEMGRTDVVAPGRVLRDGSGGIIRARALVRHPRQETGGQ